jgi:hypothetical protein
MSSSSLNIKDQVLHQYTTTSKIIVLYILVGMLLDIKQKGKRFWTEW